MSFLTLTFDDSHPSNYEIASQLEKKGIKAIFFLNDCLDLEKQVLHIKKCGHIVGNHTKTHIRLNEADTALQTEEVLNFNNKLSKILGKTVEHFSYPYSLVPQDTSLIEANFSRIFQGKENPVDNVFLDAKKIYRTTIAKRSMNEIKSIIKKQFWTVLQMHSVGSYEWYTLPWEEFNDLTDWALKETKIYVPV